MLTEPRWSGQHTLTLAQYLLQERGYIYTSKHEGWYSVSDETFYPKTAIQLVLDPRTGRKLMVHIPPLDQLINAECIQSSIETGKEVEWTSEINYHFRL